MLAEMFPNLMQEEVKQALESVGLHLGKAINIIPEDSHTSVFVCIQASLRVNDVGMR